MGVRPPQEDSSDEPETIAFGIAALDARLDQGDVEFPATQEEILRAVPNTDIPYNAAGNTLSLENAFDEVSQHRFESESELLDRLHPIFEKHRHATSGSMIAQLRALLPF